MAVVGNPGLDRSATTAIKRPTGFMDQKGTDPVVPTVHQQVLFQPHLQSIFDYVGRKSRGGDIHSHSSPGTTWSNVQPKGCVYPLSLLETKAMEDYIEEALALGHIQPSTSQSMASFFFVGKKDGGLCPCIDYRGLKAITIRYPYPLPLVPAALEQLRGAKYFTKLDLKLKTAFHTIRGHYEYLVMPFGLTNAPAVFLALINEVFQDMLNNNLIAYIDDILIYSTSFDEHVRHVQVVLTCLQHHQLSVKLEKYEFHRNTVKFLGYVISQQGVEMDLSKVHVVTEWPEPTTGKPKRLTWNELAQEAFIRLKADFTMAPILWHPDPDLPFIIEVDASSCGIGAVLSQRHRVPSKLHPCAFYSRKLTAAEANYDVGNRELVSIKATLEEWRHWLEGARHPFLVLTDHRNLEYLRGAKHLNSRQARPARLRQGDSSVDETPPSLDVEGSPAYQVRALLNSRRVRSRLQYLVD
ncbi:hypothetical protein QTP70_007641 [Hemibagrus guttatus]|uniref:ribonuclease H n=1 Tax=Hemibagrus guttatus TaxID=175788 RepID=A0AAE0R749_9TELE|nr:hypothetical protein QTP70_007641 [Hemibagrus guttatus]